jgi:hypothetical protein
MFNTDDLSTKANFILKNYFNDKEIIDIIENVTHDGYDIYGPISDIWDLYITTKENNKFIKYNYYFEEWYGEYKDYELYEKNEI